MFTKDRDADWLNIGFYRLIMRSKDELTMGARTYVGPETGELVGNTDRT